MADSLLIAAITIAYGALHSLLASRLSKRWARRRLGPAANRFYRLGYNLTAVLTLLPILVLLAQRPGVILYQLGAPWNALVIAGQLLLAGVLALGLLQADAPSFLGLRQLLDSPTSSSPLTVTGLYRWVRHPLYTAGLAFLWLMPIMTSSLLALNLVLTAYVLIGSRLEERRLLAEYGEAYHDYQRRVPALLPFHLSARR